MNQAYLNITVRVASQQAIRQLNQVNQATRSLGAAGGAAAGGLNPLTKAFGNVNKIFSASSGLEKFGKNLQWTGRQLEYNFTLPLVLAGGAATKWALDNDKAMTRVRMVYGSAADDQATLKAETDALAKSFELLSSRFGVHQQEVIEIGAAWAEAGVAGRGLAEATKLTLETMAIGAIDQEKAMTGLMAIQSAYKLNTTQLRDAVALLSGINKTGTISFAGLIDVVQRAGSVARASGIDIQHLGAMANLLTPAAGSASQAGNALRTMISRLSAPTKDTVEILGAMGISVKDFSWQASDGVKRIETLAHSFAGLSTAQKNLVASIVASRWQINRFDLLMEDVNSSTGAYAKALKETADPTKNLAVYTGMLTKYFASTNIGFKVLTTQIQNALARAILPLLPAIIALLTRITQLVTWFANLNPAIQQMALFGLLALAMIGPLAKYMGAFSILAGLAGKMLGVLAIMMSKTAANAVLLRAANPDEEVDGIALAAARAKAMMVRLTTAMWSLVTFPFRVVAGAMSLMWQAFVVGAKLAMQAVGFFLRQLVGLLPSMTQVMSFMVTAWGYISSAAVAAFGFISSAAVAAFEGIVTGVSFIVGQIGPMLEAAITTISGIMIAMPEVILTVWRTLPLFAAAIGQGIVFAFNSAAIGAKIAWEAFTEALPLMWRTLPMFAAAIGQGIVYAMNSAAIAAKIAWQAFTEAVLIAWRTLPMIAGIIGQGIMLAFTGAAVAAEIAWDAFTTAIPIVWRTLPALAGIVGQGITLAFTGAAVAVQIAWITFTDGLATIWSFLAPLASRVATAVSTAWTMASDMAVIAWQSFTISVGILWRTLPMLAGIIGQAIVLSQSAAVEAALGVWEFFSVTVPLLLADIPAALSMIAGGILVVLTSPWGLIIAAVVTFVMVFRKHLGGIAQWLMDQFNKLPDGIANVFKSIIGLIRTAVGVIADMIASINPFHHAQAATKATAPIRRAKGGPVPGTGDSDSVLALLTPGEFVINKKAASVLGPEALKRLNKYAAGGQVAASPQLKNFNDATAGGRAAIDAMETAKQKQDVLSFAPSAGPAFDALVASVTQLKARLDAVNQSYIAQEAVVQRVQTYTDALNHTLDVERNKLDALKKAQADAKDELDAAQATLDKLAHTDISGMRAMGDQIFGNEMAQKKLRLEIMKMEDAAGGSIDDMRNKLALLQGDLETVGGERNDLRMAGAGSDVLKTYDDQIAAIKEQQKATEDLVKPISDAEKELEKLQRTGEELDLQNSITFDPQLRQIDQMVNGLHEMPFDQIISSIQTQQGLVADLTTKYDAATKAVEAQQAVVDDIEKKRDAAQTILDDEKNKLDAIKDTYDQIAQSIQDAEQAIKDFASAAAAANAAAGDNSLNQDLFAAGDNANFDIPGGDSTLGREGGLADINAFNDQAQKDLEDQMKQMGKIDLFAPFKQMWDQGWKWLKENVGPVVGPVFDSVSTWISKQWDGIKGKVDVGSLFDSAKSFDPSSIFSGIADAWTKLGNVLKDTPVGTTFGNLTDILKMVGGVFAWLFGWIERNVFPVLKEIGGWFMEAGKKIWEEVQKWKPMFDPFLEALGHLYAVVSWGMKVTLAVIIAAGAAVVAAFAVVWPVVKNIVKPVFDFIVGVIIAAMEVIRGIIEVVLGLINGDWSMVWNGILAIFEGVWDAIFAVVETAFGLVYGVIKGVIESIINIFTWLYDTLIGHSIVPDIVNGIIGFFQMLFDVGKAIFEAIGAAIVWVWDNVIKPVWDAFQAVWDVILKPLLGVMFAVFDFTFKAIGNSLKWVWDNVLKPVWDLFSWIWNTILKPLISTMFTVFDFYFKAIGNALRWVWDHIIQPVWDLFTSVWSAVLKPAMGVMLDAFTGIWHAIGDGLKWVWDHVIKPVWDLLVGVWTDVLKPAMDGLAKGFKSIWDGVGNAIKDGINIGIKAINFLIRGINKVSDLVPGINFHIDEIKEVGGTSNSPAAMSAGEAWNAGMAGLARGGITNGPAVLVGEGNPLYPEYVVPTDPAHRDRAMALYGALGRDLGAESGRRRGAPETGGWGPIGDIAGKIFGAVRKGVVMATFAPFLKLFDAAVSPIPQPFQDVLKKYKNNVYNWAKGVDDAGSTTPTAGAGSVPDVPGAVYQDIINWFDKHYSKPYRVTSTYRPGDPGYHGQRRAADFAGAAPGRDTPELRAINEAFLPIAKTLKELIYAGPGGQSFKNGSPHAYDAAVRADHHDHVHAAMAQGGRIRLGRRTGGTLLRVGEGRNDEEVQVKPLRTMGGSDGETHNHFYGDLVFPNITDGNDAEAFIKNLEDLL